MEEDARPQPSKAEIVHYLAVKAAEGRDVPQDWEKALSLLYRSAELGSRLAQAELAGLFGEWTLAHAILAEEAVPEPRWENLRGAIDLAKWLHPAPRPEFSDGARIAVAEDFAAPEFCDWLIARARARLKPAKILNRDTGQSSVSNERSGSACLFRTPDSDLILAILRAKIAQLTETRVDAMEIPTVLHYLKGQEFTPHFDITLDPDAPDYRERLARGDKQRVVTFLLYLNDGYEGGETEFPVLGERWKGRKGEGLFFWNVQPDGALDQRTFHAGLPITQGEKWLLSQWIQGQPG